MHIAEILAGSRYEATRPSCGSVIALRRRRRTHSPGTTRRCGSARKARRRRSRCPEWEALRAAASAIKAHTLSHLAEYLEQFEANATARRAGPLGARRRRAQPRSCYGILQRARRHALVKSKSMLTEECDLNPLPRAARHRGHRHRPRRADRAASPSEPPSHIVLPAIHMKKEEVGELFHEHLGTDRRAIRPALPRRGRARAPARQLPRAPTRASPA